MLLASIELEKRVMPKRNKTVDLMMKFRLKKDFQIFIKNKPQ